MTTGEAMDAMRGRMNGPNTGVSIQDIEAGKSETGYNGNGSRSAVNARSTLNTETYKGGCDA